jgi:hypothetical protein
MSSAMRSVVIVFLCFGWPTIGRTQLPKIQPGLEEKPG